MKRFPLKRDIQRLELIKTYIESNLEKDLSIGVLASLFKGGRSTLRRHFSGYYKQPIHSYIIKCRMDEAKRLLLQHDYLIAEISVQVGFKERTAFNHAFVKYVGCTPLQYSQELLSETLTDQSISSIK